MSHEQVLQDRVGALRMRIRLLLAQQWMCLGLAAAALAGLLLVAATRLQWWTDAVDYLWALLVLGALTGIGIGASRRITPLVAAQIADERAGLKERLSTAVELASRPTRSDVAQAQIADAAAHAQDLRPSQVLPWRPPPQLKYLACAGALLGAALFVPELDVFKSRQEKLDREAMRQEGARVQRVAKEIEKKLAARKQKDSDDEILRRIARNMKQLGKDQERGRVSKKQAMLKMNDLQKALKEAEAKANGGENRKTLDQVAADLQQAAQQQARKGNSENAKALEKMSQSLAKRDMNETAKQLEELAKKLQSGKLSAEEAKQAADLLSRMSEAMASSNLDRASEELKDAAKRLQEAARQAQEFQKRMAQAGSEAERQQLQQQMAQAMQAAQQQAAGECQQAGGT